MYTARFDDPIAHTSAVAGLIGGATAGLVAGALVGAALVATVATGGVAAPLLIGAMLAGGALTGGALGAWVGEYIGSLSIFSGITGKITTGSPNVFVNGKPLARVKFDIGECTKASPCIPLVATGSGTVFINRLPAARVDDKLTCGGFIKEGSWNVLHRRWNCGVPACGERSAWLGSQGRDWRRNCRRAVVGWVGSDSRIGGRVCGRLCGRRSVGLGGQAIWRLAQSGHHRTAEIANRVVTGQISPDILIEAQIESPRNTGYH